MFAVGRVSWRAFFASPPANAEKVTITVEKGERFSSIVNDLHDQGIIQSEFVFRVIEKVTGAGARVQPGAHEFARGMSYADILAELTVGNRGEVSVTFPEGFTLEQMGERLERELGIPQAEWAKVVGIDSPLESEEFVIAAKKPANVDLEGYLFPDTYRFPKDVTAEIVARTMLETMAARITALGAPTGDAAPYTTHELLTLASIVEKEVRTKESMKNVADVFYKRMQIGMALQSDATLNYILKTGRAALTYKDLEYDSQYNTYKYPNLPPGAISNPGLNALTAVWHPANNPYLYFLTSDKGTIYYAETFDQHVANKTRAANE